MDNNDFVIGVLGGMGTYATVHLFQQYADIFDAEKEWERPRIIIDNRCTMPSRVRAFIYNENKEKLVDEMRESLVHLADGGCTKIILACNTSHLFLPDIYKSAPQIEDKVLNIIDICVKNIVDAGIKEVYLLASEGTIESAIYQNALQQFGVACVVPKKDEYDLLRECIEAVKQNKYSEEVKSIFTELVNRYENCILGCTELPILYEKYQDNAICKNVFDPLCLALKELKKEYEHE